MSEDANFISQIVKSAVPANFSSIHGADITGISNENIHMHAAINYAQ